MITQEMKDKGIHCKGQGFNCFDCQYGSKCAEYVCIDVNEVKEKPPIGIIPKKIWDLQRINNLKGAIERYSEANREIPSEWIEEYNDLVKSQK